MYENPITKIYGDIETQIIKNEEETVMKAIRKVEINVDKKELIKALNYDRNQYERGYKDGRNDVLTELKAELIDTAYNESKHDQKWALGLHYAANIIDKYLEENE